jgi:hypothetical protein
MKMNGSNRNNNYPERKSNDSAQNESNSTSTTFLHDLNHFLDYLVSEFSIGQILIGGIAIGCIFIGGGTDGALETNLVALHWGRHSRKFFSGCCFYGG